MKVTLPDFKNNTVVAAGQGSPVSIHSLVVARDLRIEVWNPTTGQYDVKWDPAVKPLTGQGGAAQTVIPVGPIVKSITPAGAPRVTYTLSGQLEVNGWSYTNALDLNGDLMEANMVASRMVTGTLVYNVFDNVLGRELYDIVLTFDLGGLTASAVYADPEAAP